MNHATSLALVLLAGAGLASATLGSSSYVTGKCHELLAGVQNEGHSHFELAALCRARFPSSLCRQGLNHLGKQPWSVETMRSACGSWDAQWKAHARGPAPARRTQDLVEGIEYTMEKKHELGICTGLDFSGCLQYKSEKYPAIVANLTRIIGEISGDESLQAKGRQGELPPAVDAPPAIVTTSKQIVDGDSSAATEQISAKWTGFHKTLDSSGRQSHLPWAVAGFAAGVGVGALLVARVFSGLRRRHDIICADDTQCMAAE